MALRATVQTSLATRGAASSRTVRPSALRPASAAPSLRKRVVLRAAEEDPSAKIQQQLTDAAKFLQTKWEETSDAEKPAAVAIIVGAVIAQIAIGATVDAVDRLPLVHQFLEFVGLAVTVVYAYRYFTDPAERDNVKKSLDSFVAAVTGK